MATDRVRYLRLVAGQLAVVVGMLHLVLALRYWPAYLAVGWLWPPDVRVPLWTLSGGAILLGVAVAALRPVPRRPLYAAGLAMMVVYVAGYFSWHLGGHASFYLGGDPQLHGVSPGRFLLDHLFAGPVEFVSIALEVAAAACFGALLVLD